MTDKELLDVFAKSLTYLLEDNQGIFVTVDKKPKFVFKVFVNDFANLNVIDPLDVKDENGSSINISQFKEGDIITIQPNTFPFNKEDIN